MIHLEDHEYGSCITKRDQLNIITSVSSINIMQCVFMYIVYAFADLRKTTVRCQPGPTVLHINCRLTVNKQDMTSQKFPIHYLWWVIISVSIFLTYSVLCNLTVLAICFVNCISLLSSSAVHYQLVMQNLSATHAIDWY